MSNPGALRVLHVIHHLGLGGAGRAAIDAARRLVARDQRHAVLSLTPPDAAACVYAREAGLSVLEGSSVLGDAHAAWVAGSDVVVVHAWTTPELDAFLRADHPPARWLVWLHVAGDTAPHVVTPALAGFPDMLVATSPYTADLPVFVGAAAETAVVLSGSELARLDAAAAAHAARLASGGAGFCVGYVGALDDAKMHPRFVAMSAAARVPGARFRVYGWGGARGRILREIAALPAGDAARFEVGGWLDDVGEALAGFDVFGYPLRPGCHATAELVLQEAMYVGVPPVILAHGAAQRLVVDGETGLVARDEAAYARALERLAADEGLRRRLGLAAQAHARASFGAARAAEGLGALIERLATRPARARRWPDAAGTPAERFIAALGDAGRPFAASMGDGRDEERLDADAVIGAADPAVASGSAGGVLHWRAVYPADSWLRLWSGLVLAGQGRDLLALGELSRARALGAGGWRVSWHIAQAASRIGAASVARGALDEVLRQAPGYEPAQRLLASLGA